MANISSGTWASGRELTVGDSGTGTLNLKGGSVTNTWCSIGYHPGSVGTATITGGTWVNSGDLVVGSGGTGTLTMTGGLVTVGGTLSKGTYGTINLQPGGALQIGTGGTTGVLATDLTNNGTLVFNRSDASTYAGLISGSGSIVKQGSGTLTLTGTLAANSAVVVDRAMIAEAGTIAIVQSGTGRLWIGSSGSVGLLRVSGGRVTNLDGWLGAEAGGYGSAIVSSGTWMNARYLDVGASGTGSLYLQGGMVGSANAVVGWNAGSNGIALVSGGTWSSAGYMRVGESGQGSLRLENGLVASTTGQVGYNVASVGTATVTGGTWANGGNLTVGVSGTGTLTMSGGLVTVGGMLSKGSNGTINLSPGGTLQIGTGGTTGVLGVSSLTNNGTLVFDRSDISTYSGVLSGSGTLVKRGGGTLQLIGENTYSGGTLIGAGIVQAKADTALGSGPIVITDAARRLVLGDGVTVANNIVIDRPTGQIGRGVIEYEGTGVATLTSGTITILNNVPRGGEFGVIGSGTLRVESAIVASGSSAVVMRIGTAVFNGGGEYSVFRIGEGTVRVGRDDGVSRNALAQIGWVQHTSSAWLDLAGFDQSLTGIVRGFAEGTIGNSSTIRNSTLTLTGSSSFSGAILDSIDGGTKQMCLAVDGGWLGLTNANTMSGSTTVKNGAIQLGHMNALTYSTISVLSGGTLSLTPGLVTTIGGLRPNGGGVVDVGNGSITVLDGLSSFNLYASLSVGRGSGVWDGARGIKSSAATESGGTRTVGWLDNGDGSVTFGYAAAGDTNLDWRVDVLDVANFISSGRFNTGLSATWAEGDFNYDGYADILDMGDFISSGLFNAGSYNIPTGTIAAVPEPSTLGLLGVGAGVAGLVAARRNRAA
jgi:T5SS/PEP-CTERM-associated repeat protein/autotransporter-associated beta strand protein